MREHAEGVGEVPGREGVRRIALVDEGDRRDEVGVREVRIELLDLRGEQKPFIDDRARGERTDVAVLERLLHLATDDIELALIAALQEQLTNLRHRLASRLSDCGRIRRHLAPTEGFHAVFRGNRLERLLFLLGAEDHCDCVISFFREIIDIFTEETVRNLEKKTGAIARLGVVTCRTAVHQTLEDRQAVHNHLTRGDIIQIGDQTHTAGVVFKRLLVESLLLLFVFHSNTILRRRYSKNRALSVVPATISICTSL